MEKEPYLSDVLEQIEALNKEGGEYLQLFLDMTGDYDVPPFDKDPQLGVNCFQNGLEDDINELLGLFTQNEGEDYKTALAQALRNLREMLSDRPFSQFALKALFDQYIPHKKEPGAPIEKTEHHYWVPNIELNRTEHERLLTSCGLKADNFSGKGSHIKWFDKKGRFITTSTSRGIVWVKNIIKDLLANGVLLQAIEQGCTKCNIPFRIINQ